MTIHDKTETFSTFLGDKLAKLARPFRPLGGQYVKAERPTVAEWAENFALFTLAFWLTFFPHDFE